MRYPVIVVVVVVVVCVYITDQWTCVCACACMLSICVVCFFAVDTGREQEKRMKKHKVMSEKKT